MDDRERDGTPRASSDPEKVVLTEEQIKRRRWRNYAIGLGVLLFMALIYAVTIVRLGGGASHAPS